MDPNTPSFIARRVRELNTYAEIKPYNGNWREMLAAPPADDEQGRVWKGVILSGSPHSVRKADAPSVDLSGVRGVLPVLGVCFGAQWLACENGGEVAASETREYGRAHLEHIATADPLFLGMTPGKQVWMSHGDTVHSAGPGTVITCSTRDVEFAGFAFKNEPTWAIQFHPEVYHSDEGLTLLGILLAAFADALRIGLRRTLSRRPWRILRETIGDDQVVLGLSGGVDSTVAAVLLQRAIGERLHCIFVDNGLLRLHEFDEVLEGYEGMGLKVTGVPAGQRFYDALAGLTDPELKRKAIGRVFIEVFDEESQKLEGVRWLGQGRYTPT